MRIHAEMNLDELIPLMGEKHEIGGSHLASPQEAADFRDLLVRDFPGKETSDIEAGLWHAFCCAADALAQG